MLTDCEFILAGLGLGCDHEYVVEGDDDGVVVVEVLGDLQLLRQQVRVLLYHLVYHLLHHPQVHHYVVLGQPLRLVDLFELAGGVVVDEGEDLLDALLDGVDLVDGGPVLRQVTLVLLLVLLNLLLQLLLQLLTLVVLSKSLILVMLNFLFNLVYLYV
jgi:hypothetical protein